MLFILLLRDNAQEFYTIETGTESTGEEHLGLMTCVLYFGIVFHCAQYLTTTACLRFGSDLKPHSIPQVQ